MPAVDVASRAKVGFDRAAGSGERLVGASVLSADFGALANDAAAALNAGADALHVDVMDGHFVPNLSMGPAVCGALRASLPDALLDVHLMVERPDAFVDPFIDAGADHLTIHIESLVDHGDVAAMIAARGCTAGIAVNPDTPVDRVLELADHFQLFLVMSVHPGYSGQSFIAEVLPKVAVLRETLGTAAWIQMDGGVGPSTAPACREAGCNVLVSASAIYGAQDYAGVISALRGGNQS
ncbi:MAG: ribulose-phosphate 3-epimerase [Phycisphaerales bacterium]|jgi:ribulose-phosphate 3-epimerase|nr:ribulose-phosphate 3-epimerase [Phycisphaerales bacterium]